MSPKPYINDAIFPLVGSGVPEGGGSCLVDFSVIVQIDDPDNDYPVTANLSYQAWDSSTPEISLPVDGPPTCSVYKPIDPPADKKWQSDPFTVTVDCTLAQTNPCTLYIDATDDGADPDYPKTSQFDSPCLGFALPPAVLGSSPPVVEINIRITGGSQQVAVGRPCGGHSLGGPRKIEATPKPATSPRVKQKDSKNKDISKKPQREEPRQG
jgi:hypothetical protein